MLNSLLNRDLLKKKLTYNFHTYSNSVQGNTGTDLDVPIILNTTQPVWIESIMVNNILIYDNTAGNVWVQNNGNINNPVPSMGVNSNNTVFCISNVIPPAKDLQVITGNMLFAQIDNKAKMLLAHGVQHIIGRICTGQIIIFNRSQVQYSSTPKLITNYLYVGLSYALID